MLLLLVGAGEAGHRLLHGEVRRNNTPIEPGEEEEEEEEEEEDRAMKNKKIHDS